MICCIFWCKGITFAENYKMFLYKNAENHKINIGLYGLLPKNAKCFCMQMPKITVFIASECFFSL